MEINTNSGPYVHFQPTALYTYVTVDQDGYHYNGVTYPRADLDKYGYGGVIVYVNTFGNYDAYDLTCPHCASKGPNRPCNIDGLFAICPDCGEEYDLASGTAVPTKGISDEYMRRLNLINSGGKITVTQRYDR